jgi:hypothetical protein
MDCVLRSKAMQMLDRWPVGLFVCTISLLTFVLFVIGFGVVVPLLLGWSSFMVVFTVPVAALMSVLCVVPASIPLYKRLRRP